MSKLMEEVVTALLMCNAEHSFLTPISFGKPRLWSRRCRIKTLFELDRATLLPLPRPPNLLLFASELSLSNGWCQSKIAFSEAPASLLPNSRPSIIITEDQVEERLLIDKDGLMRLQQHEASNYSSYVEQGQIPTTYGTLQAQVDAEACNATRSPGSFDYERAENNGAIRPQWTAPVPTGSSGGIRGPTVIMRERARREARKRAEREALEMERARAEEEQQFLEQDRRRRAEKRVAAAGVAGESRSGGEGYIDCSLRVSANSKKSVRLGGGGSGSARPQDVPIQGRGRGGSALGGGETASPRPTRGPTVLQGQPRPLRTGLHPTVEQAGPPAPPKTSQQRPETGESWPRGRCGSPKESILRSGSLRQPKLFEDQLTKLWWQAYQKSWEIGPYRFEHLLNTLIRKLGFEKDANVDLDTQWSFLVLKLLQDLKPTQHFGAELATAREKVDSITEIVETVSETLGLRSASLAWGCVVVLLQVALSQCFSPVN